MCRRPEEVNCCWQLLTSMLWESRFPLYRQAGLTVYLPAVNDWGGRGRGGCGSGGGGVSFTLYTYYTVVFHHPHQTGLVQCLTVCLPARKDLGLTLQSRKFRESCLQHWNSYVLFLLKILKSNTQRINGIMFDRIQVDANSKCIVTLCREYFS